MTWIALRDNLNVKTVDFRYEGGNLAVRVLILKAPNWEVQDFQKAIKFSGIKDLKATKPQLLRC
jgi:hypothetical protein